MLDKLNNLSLNIKLGVMLGLALLVGGIGYYLLVMPAAADNDKKATENKEKEKKNAELRPYKNKLGDLDRDIVELKKQAELYKLIVPDDKNADLFIIQLQEQATNSGIALRKLNALAINQKQYYAELPFGIDIDGPYYSILNFFDRLARQERYINVDGLKITASKGKGADAIPGTSIAVSCTVKTFFFSFSLFSVAFFIVVQPHRPRSEHGDDYEQAEVHSDVGDGDGSHDTGPDAGQDPDGAGDAGSIRTGG